MLVEIVQPFDPEAKVATATDDPAVKLAHLLRNNRRRQVLGNEHPDTLDTLVSLGHLRIEQQHYSQAELPLQEALRAYEKAMPESWERYDSEALFGASLAGRFGFRKLRAGLADEYHLFVAPIIIGAGKPFLPVNVRVMLELLDERSFNNGMIHLRYYAEIDHLS